MNDGLMNNVSTNVPTELQEGTVMKSLQCFGERIERWTLQRPLVASLMWMGLLFVLALTAHTPAFETNDDVVMSMIVSGTGASSRPDEHLVFSSFAIGLMLKQLYSAAPWFPWYGAYLVGIHYLCQVAVLYCLLKWRYSRAAVFCFLVLFGSVGVQLMSRLQFTSTAVWATECGIFLALNGLALRRDGEGRSGLRLIIAGMAMMILGSMVRIDSYIGAMGISAIPLTIMIWLQDRSKAPGQRLWKMALVVAVLTQIGAFGMQAAHQYYYAKDPAWKEFLIFNPYRVKFNDYCWTTYTEKTKPVFDSVQWSENDHDMIRLCFFDDPNVFGRKNLQAIVEGFPWAREAVSLRKMQHWWHEILSNVRLWPIWTLILLQIWWARDRQFAIRHFVILTLSLDAFICALMFLKNPPGRIYYPLIAFQALYTLYLMRYCDASSSSEDQQNTASDSAVDRPRNARLHGSHFQGFISGGLCAIAILGLCVGQYKANRDSRKAVHANRRLHADLARIDPLETDLFVCWGCNFPYESILPLESSSVLRRIKLLSLGWVQQSPVNDAVKEQFGISDLTQALFDNPNVYLVGQGPELPYYQTYIRERYHTDVTWDPCFEGTEFKLYKPVKIDVAGLGSSHPATAVTSRWQTARQ